MASSFSRTPLLLSATWATLTTNSENKIVATTWATKIVAATWATIIQREGRVIFRLLQTHPSIRMRIARQLCQQLAKRAATMLRKMLPPRTFSRKIAEARRIKYLASDRTRKEGPNHWTMSTPLLLLGKDFIVDIGGCFLSLPSTSQWFFRAGYPTKSITVPRRTRAQSLPRSWHSARSLLVDIPREGDLVTVSRPWNGSVLPIDPRSRRRQERRIETLSEYPMSLLLESWHVSRLETCMLMWRMRLNSDAL